MAIAQKTLTPENLELCKLAFATFDKDGSGSVDLKEVKAVLSVLHRNSLAASDEEIAAMFRVVDTDGSGSIDFKEFCQVVVQQGLLGDLSGDADTLDAFVAMGGNADKSGTVSTDKLRATVAAFELTLDIDSLIDQFDQDGSGELDYSEFRVLLGSIN